MDYCMVEVAFDSQDEVEKAVSTLLDKKLVSSCQIVKSGSNWNWEGTRECAKEYLVIMKTKKSLLNEIYEEIKKIHSYECFEFACFDLYSPNKEYLAWIDKETKQV